MEKHKEKRQNKIDAISYDKLLAVSKILSKGTRYGRYCCLKEVNTAHDKDIFKYPVRINAYIFVICSDGLIELTYNMFRVSLASNSMFIYQPGGILRLNTVKPSRLQIMIFSRDFIDELNIKLDNVPLTYKIVNEQPLFTLSVTSCQDLYSMMKLTESSILMDSSNPHYNEMVRNSFKSFIYRALYEMNDQYSHTCTAQLPTQENNHFDKFMRLLQENYMKHHTIKYYADRMNLSPKYLSLIIKKVSGRLATEWIDDCVILEAKNLIKYSSMSIQEISYALNFTNQSFFGKYFKRHTGISPKAYRLQP